MAESAMSSPSGIAVAMVRPKPSRISISVTCELVHNIAASLTMREKTAPGPGNRYAGILNATTAPHQSATMPTKVNGGSRFHATRRARRVLFDLTTFGLPWNASADGAPCQSLCRAIPVACPGDEVTAIASPLLSGHGVRRRASNRIGSAPECSLWFRESAPRKGQGTRRWNAIPAYTSRQAKASQRHGAASVLRRPALFAWYAGLLHASRRYLPTPIRKGNRRHLIESQPFVAVLLADAPLASPVVRCRGHAAAGCDRDADVEHRHLGSGERAHQHQLVQVAQVSDT